MTILWTVFAVSLLIFSLYVSSVSTGILSAYYLSEPTIDCEETCRNISTEFACLNKINTKNSKEIIENARSPLNYTKTVNLTCSTGTDSQYSKSYHPSYNIKDDTCSGFRNAPLKINCTAEEIIDEKTRRLCYCVDKDTMGYEEWAEWGLCTKPCDKGTRQRFRNCLLEVGCTKTLDKNDCNVYQCPVDGNWGEWSEYGACSHTCGFGSQTRTRRCDNPTPRHGGEDCIGTNVEVSGGCFPYPCPIHGVWSDWSEPALCSQPCGFGAVTPVQRYCNDPAPKYNGTECEGLSLMTTPCNQNVQCLRSIEVTFLVKLLDIEWDYTMVYNNHESFLNVKYLLENALMVVLNNSVIGGGKIENIHLNQLSQGSVITNFTMIFESVPSLEVLIVQDAIDKVGRIDTLNITHMNITSNDIPRQPPVFTARSLTPFTINITWGKVSNSSLNGDQYLHYIFYRTIKSVDRSWSSVGSADFSYTLIDLEPGTLYGIRMTASIIGGNGIASIEQEVKTIEGPPYIAPPNLNYVTMDYETAYLSWNQIPSHQIPGKLAGYDITYRKYFENVTTTKRVPPDLLQRTIKGLRAFTWYWFEVAGYTSAGLGPESLVVFKTPPGPPEVPPPNVTKYDYYSTNSVQLTWDAIPEEEQNGYMVGYRIRYQLVRQSGQDVIVGNPPIVLSFDRFVFAHEITGLSPYAEYKIDIYGYANEGDGPVHTITAGTCTCPEIIYTNYIYMKPFIHLHETDKTSVTGLFPMLINMIVNDVCGKCKSYTTRPIVYYNRTSNGHPSKKLRESDLKNSIEGAHLSFPIFGKFEVESFQGVFPYIGIVHSQGSAMIVYEEKVKTVGLMNIMISISNAWSVMLVAVLIASIVGWLLWFFELSSEQSDIEKDSSLVGALQGLWLAYVTMTTVGYGDFVPSNNASKLLMLVWILTGLVIMGLITGVIASGMTVGDLSGEIKLYGTETAVLKGSYENDLAIRRNAIVDNSQNYTSPLDILEAVSQNVVKIGLIDAAIATAYEDDIARLSLKVSKVIDTNSGFGIALSFGMEVIKEDTKSFIYSNRPLINQYIKEMIPVLYPAMSNSESELISVDEVLSLGMYLGMGFAGLCVMGILMWIWRIRQKMKVKPVEPTTSLTIYPQFKNLVEDFHEGFCERVNSLNTLHSSQVVALNSRRQNYRRLLLRTGIKQQKVEELFEKKRIKEIRKIKQINYATKLKYIKDAND